MMRSGAQTVRPARARARRPGARRPRNRKSSIVVAAAELFAERGFAAVGVADIAERVGITGAAIYRHLSSKEALLDAVMLEIVEAFLVAAEPGTPGSPEGPERTLAQIVADSLAVALDRPAQLATYMRERQRLDASRRQVFSRREARLFERWAQAMQAVRPHLDRGHVAVRQQALNGALSAIAIRRASVPRPRLDKVLADSGLALLLAPIRVPQVDAAPENPGWSPPRSRRDDILTVALRLFRHGGFRGVGIDEIGQAVGLSGPGVYAYYRSKSDILVDAFERAAARVQVGLERAISGATSASDALTRLTRSYVEVNFDNVDLLIVTSREGHALPEVERPRLWRRRRAFRDTWAAVVRDLRPELAEAESRTLMAGVFPLVNQVAQHRRDRSPTVDEVVDLVRAFVLGTQNTRLTWKETP